MAEQSVVPEKSANTVIDDGAAVQFGVRRYSAVWLLIALIAMIALTPFVEPLRDGDLIETVLLTMVLLFAVVAVGSSNRVQLVAGLLVTPAVFGRWVSHFAPQAIPVSLAAGFAGIFVGFVVVNLLRVVLNARVVDSDVLCAASAAYLLLGILWATAYAVVSHMTANAFVFTSPSSSPHALAGFETIYFSYAALTTLGCSDIIPTSNAARLLAMTEAMAGVFFMTILIARLVTLYSPRPSRT